VVATRVGGVPEVIPEDVAGWLAPVGDIDAMVQQSVRVLSDDVLWRSVSAAARVAAHNYSADRIVPLYEACYREVLKL